MTETKQHWLTKRLTELKKSKRQLAFYIDVNPTRIIELEKGEWRLQTSHIRKAAEFLEFDRTALLDFISGDITEDELWNTKPPIKISEDDLRLLNAVKTIAARPTDAEEVKNTSLQTESKARNGRER